MPGITDIPVEVLLDVLLPLLDISDLLHLGCTNRFFYLLTSDEPFWHRKIQEDFNFPSSDTARTTGWKFIYRRLINPKVYVWGDTSHGRLGLRLPREKLLHGVPSPTRLRISGVRVVSLVAGGMSFYAIDSKGNVYVSGALDGTGFALRNEGYCEPSKVAHEPVRLALPAAIRSLSCGRLHAAALDATGHVWNFTSWGRPFRLASAFLDETSPDSTPIQVECGWGFTSVLTESRDVLVWWPKSGEMLERVQQNDRSLENDPQSKADIAYDPSVHPPAKYIPCYVWDLSMDPARLPPIPSLPDLTKTGLSIEKQREETKLIRIAAMDNFLIGLTNKGHVLRYTKLYNEFDYKGGHWEYLPYFSELSKVQECEPFSQRSEGPLDPPKALHITHISAHFRTFIAYSTGEQSVVLMGNIDTDDPNILPPDSVKPTIHPTLQFRSVISVVLGDYHFGALTSDGKLFTWGAYSKGALGLGDPTKISPGQPGGFLNEPQRRAVIAAGNMIARPPDVTVPTEVKFGEGGRETFCFAAAAAGWHTGALVIDLQPEEDEEEREEEGMPGSFPSEPTRPAAGDPRTFTGGQGMLPFRIGFAGRGAFTGGGWRGRASPR